MFKKILYPTDFSDRSKRALDYIAQLKGVGTEEVVVCHVIDKGAIEVFSRLYWEDFNVADKEIREKAQASLQPIEDELTAQGLKVKTLLVEGIPFKEILKAEEEEQVSAIVLGGHGSSNLQELVLGSVSEKVIRKSLKTVLVVKG